MFVKSRLEVDHLGYKCSANKIVLIRVLSLHNTIQHVSGTINIYWAFDSSVLIFLCRVLTDFHTSIFCCWGLGGFIFGFCFVYWLLASSGGSPGGEEEGEAGPGALPD